MNIDLGSHGQLAIGVYFVVSKSIIYITRIYFLMNWLRAWAIISFLSSIRKIPIFLCLIHRICRVFLLMHVFVFVFDHHLVWPAMTLHRFIYDLLIPSFHIMGHNISPIFSLSNYLLQFIHLNPLFFQFLFLYSCWWR